MTEPVKLQFDLLDTIPEIQLIQVLMEVSHRFENELSQQEKDRAVNYFIEWHKQKRIEQ